MKAHDYAQAAPYERIPTGGYVPTEGRTEAFLDALQGVPVGAHDRRVINWLAGWDDPTCRTVVSLLLRARAAGARQAGRRPDTATGPGVAHNQPPATPEYPAYIGTRCDGAS